MFATLLLALTVTQNQVAQAPCSGADPAITSVAVQSVNPDGDVNRYQLAVTVVNRGQDSQGGNVLQSVDIFQDGNKVGEKGLPPLKPGESYNFVYSFVRAADAGNNTTHLAFVLDMHQPSGISSQHCDAAGDRYMLRV
jgi:hypothetical protein